MATRRPPASGSPDLGSLLLDIGGAGSLGVGGTDGAVAREALAIRSVELDKINYPSHDRHPD
jgi:hypothetical protein